MHEVQTLRNGAPLAQFTYTLGDSGVRKHLEEVGPAIATPPTSTRTIHYAYDGLYRSTAETISGASSGLNGSVGYTHDRVGNRLSRALTGAETTLAAKVPAGSSAYNPQDRLEPATNFDLNGNTLLGDVSPAQTAPDIYSFDNRLVQRSTTIGGQAATIALVYDGDGNRVKKVVTIGASPTTTYFVVDDRSPTGYPQVLEELTRSGSAWVVQRAYTWGERLLIQHRPQAANQWRFVCQDGHGNTRFLTDLSGTITDRYTYDAFGILVASSGTTPNNYLYACEQFDSELGLYYLRARYYNPLTGRFWTRDTYEGDLNNPLSLHKYLYCYADPINNIDPSGLMTWEQMLGYDAEEAIQEEYRRTHLSELAFISLGKRQHFSTGGVLKYLKPDIMVSTPGAERFLEIKPISAGGVATGIAKIAANSLAFGPKYKPDVTWQPRSPLLQTEDSVIFVINVGGIVFYQDIELIEWQLITVGVGVAAHDLLKYLKYNNRLLAPALARSGRLAISARTTDAARLNLHVGIAGILATMGAL